MPTILLVDDEKIIRTLVRVALEKHGHRVLEAGTARRAMTLARRHQGPVDLLLVEVSLPRMSGVELAAALEPERPEMRALFLARAPESSPLTGEARATGSGVLAEPFRMDTLMARVDETLATGRRKPPVRSAEAPEAVPKSGNGR